MHSWHHSNIVIRETPNKGRGLFVKGPIAKDEIVLITGGKVITNVEFTKPEYKPLVKHAFEIEAGFHICPIENSSASIDGIFAVNHSCSPTCGMRGQVSLVALRNLVAGDEITFDYAMIDAECDGFTWNEMACLCSSSECRGTIRCDDWRKSELQEKYTGYFSTYIQGLIDKESEMQLLRRKRRLYCP